MKKAIMFSGAILGALLLLFLLSDASAWAG